jgi:hypothetical protein
MSDTASPPSCVSALVPVTAPSQRHRLHALNPWAGRQWAEYLDQAIEQFQARTGAYFVTLIKESWDFESDRYTVYHEELLRRVRMAQRTIRNHLRGLDFLLQLDIGFHRTARSYGRRVCVHYHGIVWGSRADVRRAMKRFGFGFSGARGGCAKLITKTWPRALRYIAKDTRCGYVSFRRNA